MVETLVITIVAILLMALLTGVALVPAAGLSFYLATNRSHCRTNLGAGVLSSALGLIAGGLAFDPVALTPPAQAYLIVGAWLGGTLGVVVATIARFLANPSQFRLQRSVRSWFIVVSLVCLGCATVAFIWSLDW